MIEAPHCRSARTLLNWSEEDLAHAALLSPATVRAFEEGADLGAAAQTMLQLVLESAGVAFVWEGNGDAGVYEAGSGDVSDFDAYHAPDDPEA